MPANARCDRLKTIAGSTFDTMPWEREAGITRYTVTGAADIRYWEARTGDVARRDRSGRRCGMMTLVTYTPTMTGGCDLGHDDPPMIDGPIDFLALLGLTA
jgi:hypothetical protein